MNCEVHNNDKAQSSTLGMIMSKTFKSMFQNKNVNK